MATKTKYRKEFCDKLIDHMREGNSFGTFGAIVHVTEKCLNEWCIKYKDFAAAKELGKVYEEYYWVNILKNGAQGKMDKVVRRSTIYGKDQKIKQQQVVEEPAKFNATATVFALKNKFPDKYRDTQTVDLNTKDGLDGMSDEEIERRKQLYMSVVLRKNKDAK